jgi:hypothetical protein
MRTGLILAFVLLAAAAGASIVLAARAERATPAEARAQASVRALVAARPFTLARPAQHVWRANPRSYDAGWLVVLEVDPAFAVPRQTTEPVLMAGGETVERYSSGELSARVVALVPSARGADGRPALDLAATPFFHGPEALPEELADADLERAFERAVQGGLLPFPAAEVAAALERGGDLLVLPSRDELDEVAGLLVLEHAPADVDVGTGLLAPRVAPR